MESKLGTIRGVIFDLDDVLIDSFYCWFKLFNYALKNFSKKEINIDTFKSCWGQGMEKDIEIYMPHITLKELQNFYEENFLRFSKYIKLFPETKGVLRKLKEKKYLLFVASNSSPKIVSYCLKSKGIEKYFDLFLGASHSLKGKPKPDMLLKILKELNLKNKEVIFVGDSQFDMEAGKRAKILTIGINIKGDFEIKNLGNLIDILEKF